MTVNEALAAMLALYAAPGAWTGPGVAQDAAGREVAPTPGRRRLEPGGGAVPRRRGSG